MEHLTMEELRGVLRRQLEAATCSVCLEVLGPQLVLCQEGHGVCTPCHSRLRLCPVCKATFSEDRHTLLAQLLQSIPHQCPNKGCSHFVRAGDNHKDSCGFRPTPCMKCDWVGCGNRLLDHVRSKHSKLHVFTENNSCWLTDFNRKEAMCDYAPVHAYNQLYWAECSVNPYKGYFKIKYHFVHTGEQEKATYVVIQMKSSKVHVKYNLSIRFLQKSKSEDNAVFIGLSTLDPFIDKKNRLNYTVDFYQGDLNDKALL